VKLRQPGAVRLQPAAFHPAEKRIAAGSGGDLQCPGSIAARPQPCRETVEFHLVGGLLNPDPHGPVEFDEGCLTQAESRGGRKSRRPGAPQVDDFRWRDREQIQLGLALDALD
jgi:hypothetical protein